VKEKSLLLIGLMALLLSSVNAFAVSVSGYINAEYNDFNLQNPSSDVQQKPPYGGFDVNRVGIVFQHEADIYKSYAQIQFLHAPEFAEDGDGKGTNSGKPVTFGEVALEKAYIEARISKEFHLKIGKEVTPTLWQRALYPSLYQSISIPQMVETIFHEYIVGAIASGELPHGFIYDLWLQNADNVIDDSNGHKNVTERKPTPSQGLRFGWTDEGTDHSVYLGVLGARYTDKALKQKPYGFETALTFKQFSLWGEYNKGKEAEAFYLLPSYSFKISDDSDISPYFFYDSFKEANTTKGDARKVYAAGINYKPTSYITTKAEYVKTPASNDELVSSAVRFGLIYYFN
jgi:hypothetical protein